MWQRLWSSWCIPNTGCLEHLLWQTSWANRCKQNGDGCDTTSRGTFSMLKKGKKGVTVGRFRPPSCCDELGVRPCWVWTYKEQVLCAKATFNSGVCGHLAHFVTSVKASHDTFYHYMEFNDLGKFNPQLQAVWSWKPRESTGSWPAKLVFMVGNTTCQIGILWSGCSVTDRSINQLEFGCCYTNSAGVISTEFSSYLKDTLFRQICLYK